MYAPLYDALIKYSQTKYPFHMPGHKLGRFGNLETMDLFKLDVTEANGLDNLYEAEGIIEEAMQAMAAYYGAKTSTFLTNGSTAGILASILALCKPGEKILVARNAHHSVWHALILSGAIPIYMTPTYDVATGLLTTLSVQEVERQLLAHPDVKGALIVSPTYEGVVSDIEAIAACLHAQDKCLIVDEAHGAHFGVHDYFPESSLRKGADIVIHSMHKTLPTLTQSGLIHRGSERIPHEKLIQCLRMVQTSSPSYAMMGLMDFIRATIEEEREALYASYIEPLIACRKALENLHALKLYTPTIPYDKGKIIILTQDTTLDGYTLAEQLETGYGLVVEAALPSAVIIMTTLADDREPLEKLAQALLSIDKELKVHTQHVDKQDNEALAQLLREMPTGEGYSPREIYYEATEKVAIQACEGRISKTHIMLYPPGIPLICTGEVFTARHIQSMHVLADKLKGIIRDNGQYYCLVVK